MTSIQRAQIEEDMIRLGFKISNKGFSYIIDAIDMLYNDPTHKITSIYHQVATNYDGVISYQVERCIRHEIENLYANNSMSDEELIPPRNKDRFSNKEFLHRLLYRYMCILKIL